MRYDTVIIGGGLAGLTAGIELLKRGQKVAAVSTGQSALHFNSGSLDLMGRSKTGRDIINPLQGIMSVGVCPAGLSSHTALAATYKAPV